MQGCFDRYLPGACQHRVLLKLRRLPQPRRMHLPQGLTALRNPKRKTVSKRLALPRSRVSRKDDQGIWRANAKQGGKQVAVSLDFRGNVAAQ